MILVTVGTEKFPFNRLMEWLETLIERGFLNLDQEEVIVQFGSSTVFPSGVRVYQLLPEAKFHELIRKSRLIIAHCGEGTLNVLETTPKPYLLVPRSQRFGEHVDDHQVEMAIALAGVGVPVAWSPADLVDFIATPRRAPLTVPLAAVVDLCQRLETRFA
jgi:UDP-N-acetylglucosamine transferase subunit ALG13